MKNKKPSLQKKIILHSIIVFALFSALIVIINHYLIVNITIKHEEKTLNKVLNKTAQMLKIPLWEFDETLIKYICKLQLNNKFIQKIELKIEGGKNLTFANKDTHFTKLKKISKDIVYKNTYLGSLTFHYTMLPVYASVKKQVGLSLIYIFAMFILFYSLIIYLLKINIFKPLSMLQNSLQNVGKGEFKHIDNSKLITEETSKIAAVFNEMVDKLKEREEEIEKTSSLLSKILNSMPSPLVIFDKNLKIVHHNKRCIKFFKKLEIDFSKISHISEIPFLEKHIKTISTALNTGDEHISIREKISTLSGDIYLKMIAFNIQLEDEKLAAIRFDDITKEEEQKNSLIQAQKFELIGTLASGLSHDLNNILNIITTSTSILELKINDKNNNIENLKYLEAIKDAAYKASSLVTQLLTLAKKTHTEKMTVEINKFIAKYIDMAKNTIDKSVTIIFEPYPKKIYTKVDPTQFEQVILNLIINAEHSMTIMRKNEEWGGTLTITTNIAKNSWIKVDEISTNLFCEIEISDTGVGISKENLKKVFDPFFTTKDKKGSGLGLSMVKSIIEDHNGKIKIESQLGKGTKVMIYLPVAEEKTENIYQKENNIFDKKLKGTILLVDDEKEIREAGEEILTLFGLKTILAEDGLEAIEIYKDKMKEIDLILLDLVMPFKPGNEIFRQLIEINPQVKVIMTSGFRHDKRIEEALSLGAKGFVGKPYKLEELYQTLKIVLES